MPRRRALPFVGLLILLAGLMLGGCGGGQGVASNEEDELHFRRGRSYLREERHDEALLSFLKVIENRREAPESHLDAGLLYLNHVKDPIAAIYHFRRYLEIRPASEKSEFVRQLIDRAQKDFAGSLPGLPSSSGLDRLDLVERLEALQAEILDLKRRLAVRSQENAELRQALEQVRQRYEALAAQHQTVSNLPPAPSRRNEDIDQPEDAGNANVVVPEQYTVVAGDTLSRIARKVYGDGARWQAIFEANRDVLPRPDALRPGQVLRIPQN